MNKLLKFMMGVTQHYNHSNYWKMREKIVQRQGWILLRYIYLYRIKRMDAFNGASMGTHLDKSATFMSPPNFPHGIRGIFVSHNSVIGSNATNFHQVTMGEGTGGAPQIGNDCYIGAGAKIIGNIKVGNNVRSGANCIVCENIPDNCTVVMNKPRIISRNH